MDVKKSLVIFILAGGFWFLVFIFAIKNEDSKLLNPQDKFGIGKEKYGSKNNSYTKEQKEFIEIFQSSFEDR
ncbi:hypothetical protein [Fluviispira multicolorata]|uniref:Uncharacterized protein n=1 Tax=Fluviispira multicolorata TaxID=2654512 RepID=A0A833JCK9_9BACT|nr:hypothetical protein [Fluviispira multicolorata]KAB8030841.1 hypothetical protein GCL57_07655 [Fluviispira multicolorata]